MCLTMPPLLLELILQHFSVLIEIFYAEKIFRPLDSSSMHTIKYNFLIHDYEILHYILPKHIQNNIKDFSWTAYLKIDQNSIEVHVCIY